MKAFPVERPLKYFTPPYWIGFTRASVASGWRNRLGKSVSVNFDTTQFKKFNANMDCNRVVMGTVGYQFKLPKFHFACFQRGKWKNFEATRVKKLLCIRKGVIRRDFVQLENPAVSAKRDLFLAKSPRNFGGKAR